jgi:hypothetical protein
VTVNRVVFAGSAVAVNPVRTHAWLPCDTVIATGRFVFRRFVTAERSAESKLPLATSR